MTKLEEACLCSALLPTCHPRSSPWAQIQKSSSGIILHMDIPSSIPCFSWPHGIAVSEPGSGVYTLDAAIAVSLLTTQGLQGKAPTLSYTKRESPKSPIIPAADQAPEGESCR